MLLLKISDVKSFMSKLLVKQVFDHFLMSELEIKTYGIFSINGKLDKEWFDSDEQEDLNGIDYVEWSRVKQVVYQIIKGNKAPEYMKVVFVLSPKNHNKLILRTNKNGNPEDVSRFFLNMKYENGEIFLTTGVAYTVFTMNKMMEEQWDIDLKKFLQYYEIEFEEN